jgi:probable HAF family extracellular repeat protein
MLRTSLHGIGSVLSILGSLAIVEPSFTVDSNAVIDVALLAQGDTPSYTVVDVGTFEQGGGGMVRGLSSADEIIGSSRSQSGKRGFRLGARGSADPDERLDGFPGSDASVANAINEGGTVVGSSNMAVAVRAFLWTRQDGFSDLGTLPGDSSSEAWGINRHNEVVGQSSGPDGIEAVFWDRDGSIQRLGRLRSGDHSRAYAVNEGGDVVGSSGKAGFNRAFLWTRGSGMEDLGAIAGNDQSFATAINNSGEVVGYSSGAMGDRAFLWSRNGGMTSLGTFPGGDHSRALAINEPGDVVGTAGTSSSEIRAALWTSRGEMHDLNALIRGGAQFVLTEAVSINNRGLILAIGQGNGHEGHENPTRIVLLVP